MMGLQQVRDVTLIRHAYVRTGSQKQGVGSQLLSHLRVLTERPGADWNVGRCRLGNPLL